MKKFLRIVLILIFIIFIIFLVNLTRNYLILKSLFSFNEEINNYYFEETITFSDIKYKNCIYAQNNNYYIELYENDKHIYNIWIDDINKEYTLQDIEKNQITKEEYNDFYTKKYKAIYLNSHDVTISNLIIQKYLFMPIIEEDNKYILTVYDNETKVFINKDSKSIDKVVSKDNEINYKLQNNPQISINKPEI